jgi:hypothetical protein
MSFVNSLQRGWRIQNKKVTDISEETTDHPNKGKEKTTAKRKLEEQGGEIALCV